MFFGLQMQKLDQFEWIEQVYSVDLNVISIQWWFTMLYNWGIIAVVAYKDK